MYRSDQTEKSQTINETLKLAIQTLNLQRTSLPQPLSIITGLLVKPELKCAADKVPLACRLYGN